MSTKLDEYVIALTYVNKHIKKDPAKAIKFIYINREYFKNITDEHLLALKKENNVTDEMLEKVVIDK